MPAGAVPSSARGPAAVLTARGAVRACVRRARGILDLDPVFIQNGNRSESLRASEGAGDPLTAAEQAQYERLKSRPLPRAFAELLREELEKRSPTLPRGVGAGPSGHRCEHLRAVADSAAGSHAVVELCIDRGLLLSGEGSACWDSTRLISLDIACITYLQARKHSPLPWHAECERRTERERGMRSASGAHREREVA